VAPAPVGQWEISPSGYKNFLTFGSNLQTTPSQITTQLTENDSEYSIPYMILKKKYLG